VTAPITPEVNDAAHAVICEETVTSRTLITSVLIELVIDKLLPETLPVTVTFPSVALPPELVEVNVSQANALVVLSAGHTFNVLSVVLNHN
jgi:hypothetical protein